MGIKISKGENHIIPVIFAIFVAVFSLIFLYLSFLWIIIVASRRRIWAIFIVLDEWKFLI